MKMKAVIFDMDGVLIDSEPLWQQAQIKCLLEYGVKITVEDCIHYTMGRRIDSVSQIWCKLFKLEVSPKIIENAIVTELCILINTEGKSMPGVVELLNYLYKNGYKIAIATSSSNKLIETVLKKLKIAQFFSILCSADNEEHGKPHPAVYLSAVRKLRLEPGDCVVLEDSLNGLIAAKAASITTFLVGETCNLPKFAFADKQLNSLHDVIPLL